MITAPGDLNITDTVASPHCKNRETNYRRYYRYHRYFKSKIPVYCEFKKTDIDHHYSLGLYTPVSCGLRSTADSDPQFFLRMRTVSGSKLHLTHINLQSSGRMCPTEKQTMKLQARAVCASAVHVISADPFRNESNTCGIPQTQNLKIRTPLINAHRVAHGPGAI